MKEIWIMLPTYFSNTKQNEIPLCLAQSQDEQKVPFFPEISVHDTIVLASLCSFCHLKSINYYCPLMSYTELSAVGNNFQPEQNSQNALYFTQDKTKTYCL